MKKNILFLGAAVVLVLGTMLLVGLKPKGFRLRNEVSWLKDTPGISFSRIGIAFTEDPLTWPARPESADCAITIELSIKPARAYANGIPCILSFWDRAAPDPLVIGQWRNHLIIRKRDPRSRRGYREMGADSALPRDSARLIDIASGGGGTIVYVNGEPDRDSERTSLVSGAGLSARLVLGNSATGQNPWYGELYGVTIFARELAPSEVARRYRAWDSLGRVALPIAPGAMVRYAFDEGHGRAARNTSGIEHQLWIPGIFRILQKQILTPPWKDFRPDLHYLEDVAVNFAGFMPFGFLLAALLMTGLNIRRRRAVAMTVLAGFLLSLFIELAQVWIPTRSSQLSDLMLNTLGACVGAMAGGWKWNWSGRVLE